MSLNHNAGGVVEPDNFDSPVLTQVDVEYAERTFENLSQHLSANSVAIENGQTEIDENTRFDLEGYLRNQKRQEEEHDHHNKFVDVSWDITVKGFKDAHEPQPTFAGAVANSFGILPVVKKGLGLSPKTHTEEFNILNDIKGIAKAGEMILVLGRPGSGCSSFLKTIANRREGFIEVVGDVLYNGISSEEFKAKYQGETVYSQEDDIFLPSLTVNQVCNIPPST
jgi:ATP-binding cassette, subfamily G (WHITE), member 2, SNQ2